MPVKQVIVIRRDLGMRRGKEIAQGSHASMEWLRDRLVAKEAVIEDEPVMHEALLTQAEMEWLNGNFTKVTVQASSEAELRDLQDAAHDLGLEAHLITDLGKTEFAGVPTVTALAIGPDDADVIDQVTGHLKLY